MIRPLGLSWPWVGQLHFVDVAVSTGAASVIYSIAWHWHYHHIGWPETRVFHSQNFPTQLPPRLVLTPFASLVRLSNVNVNRSRTVSGRLAVLCSALSDVQVQGSEATRRTLRPTLR